MPKCKLGDVVLIIGERVGVVRFYGRIPSINNNNNNNNNNIGLDNNNNNNNNNIMVGVEIFMTDSGYGDCNGTYAGVQLFQCPDNHGLFIKESDVQRIITSEQLLEKVVLLNKESRRFRSEKHRLGSTVDSCLRKLVQANHIIEELQNEIELLKEELIRRERNIFSFPSTPSTGYSNDIYSTSSASTSISYEKSTKSDLSLKDGYDLIDNSALQELREYLKQYPTQLNHCDPLKGTLAIWAIRRGDTTALDVLHSLNINLEQADHIGWTPLFYSVIWDRDKMVEQLLKWGVVKEPRDIGSWNPLVYSCIQGSAKMIQLLAKYGYNMSRTVYGNKTPLTLVAERGKFECIQVMKNLGVNLTPGIIALENSKKEMSDSLKKRCLILLGAKS